MQTIGKKISTLRKNKGITQEQLAEALSISAHLEFVVSLLENTGKWHNGINTS